MFADLKRLVKDSLVYGIGTVSRSLLGFVLIPLYTRYLTTEEYGVLSLALVALASLNILFELGMSKALFRFYFDTEGARQRHAVVGSCLLALVVLGIPLLIVFIIFARTGADLALSSPQYSTFWVLVAVSAFFESLITLPYALLRAELRAKAYTVFFLANLFLLVTLTSLFLAGLEEGINGVLVARLISSVAIFLCFLPLLLHNARLSPSLPLIKELLFYGLPFVPLGLIGWALRYINRYFLEHYTSLETIGIYSLGGQVGMAMIILVVGPFQLVWAPYKFIIAKDNDAREKFSLFFTYFFFLSIFVGLVLSALAPELVRLMSTPPYYDASAIVPWVVLAYILYGLSFHLNIGIDLEKKTYLLPFITGAGLLVGMLCNLLLIPDYGMRGAALAFAASYAVLPVLMYLACRHLYRIEYQFGRLLHITLVAGSLFALSLVVDHWAMHLFASLLIKIFILMTFFPVLFITGFLSQREKSKLVQLWHSVRATRRTTP